MKQFLRPAQLTPVTFASVLLWSVLIVSQIGSASTCCAADKPNFIVFLADDLGWGDLGCYGHPKIKTPNLDKFASEGVRFTQAYAACGVCSPSRSSVLTGRTPYRNGVWRWLPVGNEAHLRASEITIPESLRPLGYQTMHSGKWHLNGYFNRPEQPQPNDHGYDWWFATQNNASPSHKDPINFVRNGKEVGPLTGFSAPLVSQEASAWLKKERDPSQPFFITVWTHEPHLPIESDPEFQQLYKEIENPGVRQHHGNITQLDHAFGNLMTTVDELGLRDNTFVIFTSDNGPEGSGKGNLKNPQSQQNRTWGSTGGLRGRKRDSHEGGIRVPGIVRWPGRIKPGTQSDVPIIGSDIFTTVLEIAGAPLPTDRTIDGVNLIPACERIDLERPVPLFWRTHIAPPASHAAMRIGDWKIIADQQLTKFQLYQIAKDPTEENDLASKMPEKLAEMKIRFMEVWKGVEAEGPREWWANQPQGGKRKKGPKLPDGTDDTGEFDVVKGATVSVSDLGYLLEAGAGEGFALQKLDVPIQESATFKIQYRTAVSSVTRNACFCFGSTAQNDRLYKAGTLIGMGRHGAFDGSWANVGIGAGKKSDFDPNALFTATVTIDLDHGKLVLNVDGQRIEHQLPGNLESVDYVGIYAKNTKSEFSKITRVE
ncbi:sulfatase-like hydrolase/transferase [Planctomycetes bacterium K23_9]|uniref:Arylsulfatase n=1 Tax=Stieleria marina TaxID=1930275 RepID=A0A517NXC1_9BACT|nr:Arylsulfatase [Planctomycetes bacterium K23_9]